jgi:hypothetical protein
MSNRHNAGTKFELAKHDDAFVNGNLERVYFEIREYEKQSQEILVDSGKANPRKPKGESIDEVLAKARRRLGRNERER